MKFILNLVITLWILVLINADQFIQYYYIDRGILNKYNHTYQKDIDYDNDGNEEIVIDDMKSILFYEYGGNNSFILVDSIPLDTNYPYIGICDIGDLDNDGLKDALIGKAYSNRLWVYEQSSPVSFFDSVVWTSDTIYNSVRYLGITNKLKGDGIDRIYGAGIPWLTTPVKGYGWYYLTCTGDNQYEILNTFEESTWFASAMDIGDLNGNGLTDMIITSPENYLYFYESIDAADDSFIKQDSLTENRNGADALLILPDIDRDGRNEYFEHALKYLLPPCYGYAIMEDTSGTGVYDTIWRRDFEVMTDYIWIYGGDIGYGDIDGDSMNEIVLCGGRHIEVWESTGDNQFEMMWEYTDSTYKTIHSFIGCNDFNKNGIEEIIFSGYGDGVGDQCTRIFEMKRWSMGGDTIEIGNSETGDTIYKEVVIKNESDGVLTIDSIGLKSISFGFSDLICPITITGKDSVMEWMWFKGDSIGRYVDSMEVYADKTDYKEYLKGGNKLELIVDSVKAYDGFIVEEGIDNDDMVVFYFGAYTNQPEINEGNIDSLLRISGGDEWDIAGEGIELTKWLRYADGDRFYIYFETSGKVPTVKVGDTVYSDGETIIGEWIGERWTRPVVITGSFGPTGTGSREQREFTKVTKLQIIGCKTIIWETVGEGRLSVYDISGREVIREERTKSGEHRTDIRQLKNGIYFIKLKDNDERITEKQIIIR